MSWQWSKYHHKKVEKQNKLFLELALLSEQIERGFYGF